MSEAAGASGFFGWVFEFIFPKNERRGVKLKRLMHRLAWWKSGGKLPRAVFEPLSPVDVDDDRIAIYEAELLNGLRNEGVRNIAITGGYGAGKSSLIKTFVKRHPEYKYAFISLASFEEKAVADPAQDPADAVEAAIVQQLLYSVSAAHVPGTRLKRISHVGTLAVLSRVTVAALGVVFYLRLKMLWPVFLPNLSSIISWIPKGVAEIGVVVSSLIIAFWVIRSISSLRVRELTLGGVRLEGGLLSRFFISMWMK